MKILIVAAEVDGGMYTCHCDYATWVQSVSRCVRNATDGNIDGCVLDTRTNGFTCSVMWEWPVHRTAWRCPPPQWLPEPSRCCGSSWTGPSLALAGFSLQHRKTSRWPTTWKIDTVTRQQPKITPQLGFLQHLSAWQRALSHIMGTVEEKSFIISAQNRPTNTGEHWKCPGTPE